MKILIIHTEYTQPGGEDTVVSQEANLLKQKHNVKTLLFKNRKGLAGFFQFAISIWNIRSAFIVRSQIKEFKPDIIHLHNWHFASGPIVIRVANKMGVPIINTLHNYRLICPSGILLNNNQLFLDSINQSFPWSAISKKAYKNSIILSFWLAVVVWFHRKIKTWEMVSTYLCLTPSAIDLFTDSWMAPLKNKFRSKPNFTISEKSLNEKIKKRGNHFIYIGRLSEEKGLKLLIDAFQQLPYQLKIAGDGPLKEDVIKATTNSNISYLGTLNSAEVSNELSIANALIFPSIWFETFGLVITEAFSNSCAVLSTNIGAPKSIVNNGINGFCFESNNIESLKETIRYWEALPILQKEEIRSNALNTYKEKYSPTNQHKYFDEIYRKVL